MVGPPIATPHNPPPTPAPKLGFTNATIPPLPQPGSNPPLNNPNTTVPPPPNYDPGKGPIQVNTVAMVTFANNIDQLKQMLLDSISDLEGVKLAAGGWPNAVNLASGITGHGKLRDSTQSVIQSMHDTIVDLSAATRKLAADFTKSEDLNNLSAAEYAKYLAVASGDVNSLGSGSNNGGTGS